MTGMKKTRSGGTGGDGHKKPRKQVPVPLELVQRLERIAQLNERPVGWEVARALRTHIESEERRLGIQPDGSPE